MTLFAQVAAIYGKGDRAKRCVRLQDEHGFDVGLGLSAIVCGLAGRVWTAALLDAWRQDGWTERAAIAAALRHARRLAGPPASKDPAVASLRDAMLVQELAAERLAIDWLEEQVGQPPPSLGSDRSAALANLRLVAGPVVPQHRLDPLLDA